MSKQADRLRASVARSRPVAAAVDPAATREDDDRAARPEAVSTVRTKPYRRSVDLPPARHFALDAWTAEASRTLGCNVTGIAVMNALVQRLLTDERLAAEIMADPELRPAPRGRRT